MSLLGLGEFHAFGAAGQRFLYLVPSAAVFALDEPGLGRFDFSFRHDVNEEPGFFTGSFYVQDPVQNRRLMGIARINLAERDIDFYTLGPFERISSFSVAPGRQKAYGLLNQIGHYELWTFDLAGRRLEHRQRSSTDARGWRSDPAVTDRSSTSTGPATRSICTRQRPTAISAPSRLTAT